MSDGKRVYLYFPESDMPAYEALQRLCPESVPLATFLRSVLVRYAFGKLQYTSEHSERYGNSESASVETGILDRQEWNERSFLSGIDGMLVDDSEDQEG
jgi:hypothetical protein